MPPQSIGPQADRRRTTDRMDPMACDRRRGRLPKAAVFGRLLLDRRIDRRRFEVGR